MINERSKRILWLLLEAQRPVTVNAIAEKLGVSARTVRYDLDSIDDWLLAQGIVRLDRSSGVGLRFGGNVDERKRSRELMGESNPRYYVLSPQERVALIIAFIAQQPGFVTIDKVAERLSVGRSTVVADLVGLKQHFSAYSLTLQTSRRCGLKISGAEKAIRSCLLDFLSEHVLQTAVLFTGMDIKPIEQCVRYMEGQLGVVFSDVAFSRLTLSMALAMKRLELGQKIELKESTIARLQILPAFNVVNFALSSLETQTHVQYSLEEIADITEQIMGSSVTAVDGGIPTLDLQLLASRLIATIGRRLGANFMNDPQLFQGLVVHLGPALQRCRTRSQMVNPHLADIEKYQAPLMNVVRESVAGMIGQIGAPMSAAETGYLTLHFAAAIERSKLGSLRQNVLIVCGVGLGTAKLLSAKLTSLFDVNVIGTVAAHQIELLADKQAIDLVITTIPIENIDLPTYEVSPLLTPGDVEKLKAVLRARTTNDLSIHRVLDIVKKHCTIQENEALKNELMSYLGIAAGSEGVAGLSLRELMSANSIRLDVEVMDWEAAVRLGGELLRAEGKVEEAYIEGMVTAIKQLGPYVVIAPGIALPHAAIRLGVNDVGMSFIRLKTPVAFEAGDRDPVDLIFTFSTPDKISHVQALHQLGRMIGDDEALSVLRQATGVDEILKIVEEQTQQGVE